jgi:hypothetical protein
MRIGRRHFISLLGSAAMAALPRAAAAQQLPVVGFLHPALVESYVSNAAGFARGLKERGFAEAQNLSIESALQMAGSTNWRRWQPIWSAVCRL